MKFKSLCLATLMVALPGLAAESPAPQWRTLDPQNTLYMETETGRIVFELAKDFAPNHVDHIKKLARAGFYDGLTFYRVIDGFVVQGGDPQGKSQLPEAKRTMKAEFERTIKPGPYTEVQNPAFLAAQTGFVKGFAVGRSPQEKKEWLLSCPGTINLARSNDPDSGTTDFAIMIGQATRHLDRNMSTFGRIVHGMEHLNLVKRGGFIENPDNRSKIIKVQVAADVPEAERLHIEIEKTDTPAFSQMIEDRRKRTNDFFIHKGNGNLDICYLKPKVKVDLSKAKQTRLAKAQQQLSDTSKQITDFFAEYGKKTEQFLNEPFFKQWFAKHDERGADMAKVPGYHKINQHFIDTSKHDVFINSAFFGSANTGEYFREDEVVGASQNYYANMRPWWRKTLELNRLHSGQPSKAHGYKAINSAIEGPLYDDNNQLIGVGGLDLNIAKIGGIMTKSPAGKKGNQLLLLDQDKNILYLPESMQIATMQVKYDERGEAVLDDNINEVYHEALMGFASPLVDYDKDIKGQSSGFGDLATACFEADSGRKTVTLRGKSYWAFCEAVKLEKPLLNWHLVLLIPY